MAKPVGIYIQFGCGPGTACPREWINFDVSPTLRLQRLPVVGKFFRRGATIFPEGVCIGDIVKGLPVPSGSARGVYASHVLEHLSLKDFQIALENTFQMLMPGGIFRVVVPDLEGRARKYLEKLSAGDVDANSWFMKSTSLGVEDRKRGIEALARSIFGNTAHLWMWDETSMSAALRKVGFIDVRRCRFNDSRDQTFHLIEDKSRFYAGSVEELAIEAIKPGAGLRDVPTS